MVFMEITAELINIQPEWIISEINRGQEITITWRGKPSAKIVPIYNKENSIIGESDGELFGIWKNKKEIEGVEQYVRNIRKWRKS
jgi:antitoxin (DNA-binding transcriptional repressor) of toxin-antitoxin stability system